MVCRERDHLRSLCLPSHGLGCRVSGLGFSLGLGFAFWISGGKSKLQGLKDWSSLPFGVWVTSVRTLPTVSTVVPLWGYLIGSQIYFG